MVLASIIYQTHPGTTTGFFHTTEGSEPLLPMEHGVRGNQLFQDGQRLSRLQEMVRCGFADDEEFTAGIPREQIPTLTGMSPHVKILRQNEVIIREVKRMKEAYTEQTEQLPGLVKDAITDQLTVWAETNGHATANTLLQMEERIQGKMQSMFEKYSGLGTGARTDTTPSAPAATSSGSGVGFTWGDGSTHALPEQFQLPQSKFKTAWYLWWLPNTSGPVAIPPLRTVRRSDFGLKKQKNKFSGDWAPCFRGLEKRLKGVAQVAGGAPLIDANAWKTQPSKTATSEQVDLMWSKVSTWIPADTKQGKKRSRPEDFAVSFAKKMFAKKKKTATATTASTTPPTPLQSSEV